MNFPWRSREIVKILSNYVGIQNNDRQTCTYFLHLHLKQSRVRYIFEAFFTQKAAQTRERRKQLTFSAQLGM